MHRFMRDVSNKKLDAKVNEVDVAIKDYVEEDEEQSTTEETEKT